jgi:hypothetical protein
LFGYSQSQALAYNIVTQVSGMFLILLWGLAGLWQLGMRARDIQAEKI